MVFYAWDFHLGMCVAVYRKEACPSPTEQPCIAHARKGRHALRPIEYTGIRIWRVLHSKRGIQADCCMYQRAIFCDITELILHDGRHGVPCLGLELLVSQSRACLSTVYILSLIHISEPTRRLMASRMPSSA